MKTAICVIVRNEERGLLEWIAYHRMIGFDEILVYDNLSTDGTAEICEALAAAKLITYRLWPDPPPDYHIGPQVPAYEHAAANTRSDWLCFLDADEFLVLEDANSVLEFLSTVGQPAMPIALSWKIFGSSGEVQAGDGLVTDRFIRCGNNMEEVNRHIKTLGPSAILFKGARVHVHGWILETEGLHYVNAKGSFIELEKCTFVESPCWGGAWVNHYIVKSQQEFGLKQLRGKATHPVGAPDKYDRTYEGYFLKYDRNENEDKTIHRFRPKLLAELENIGQIIKQNRRLKQSEFPIIRQSKIMFHPKILFIHIPKTAGTYIIENLRQNFDEDKVFGVDLQHVQLNDFLIRKPVIIETHDLVGGHIPFRFVSEFAHHFDLIISVIRSPLRRALSMFSYILQQQGEEPPEGEALAQRFKVWAVDYFYNHVETRNEQCGYLGKVNRFYSVLDTLSDYPNFRLLTTQTLDIDLPATMAEYGLSCTGEGFRNSSKPVGGEAWRHISVDQYKELFEWFDDDYMLFEYLTAK